MKMVPVAVFAFNRPVHLAECLDALRNNPESAETELHIFCDGARGAQDAADVRAVRDLARSVRGFASVNVVEQPANLGLANSVIAGVSSLLARYDDLIVLEDDLVVSEYFLSFMNAALELYRDEPRVASIHAYLYPLKAGVPDTFFLRGADCWGWATWARAWKVFDADGEALLRKLRAGGLEHAFDLDGAYPYTRMLEEQVAGRNSSWAIRWHASCFLADMLTLYPGHSLVQNIGNDASGTHCADTDQFLVDGLHRPVRLERTATVESETARRAIAEFLRPSARERVAGTLRRILGRIRRRLT